MTVIILKRSPFVSLFTLLREKVITHDVEREGEYLLAPTSNWYRQ